MNDILISDPFLCPPSGEDIFRGPKLPKNILEYSEKQFKQAWEVAFAESETTVKSFKLWPSASVVSSPTISSTSEDLALFFDQMDSQDNAWLEQSSAFLLNDPTADELFDLPPNECSSYQLDASITSHVPGIELFHGLQEIDAETIDDVFKDKEEPTTTFTAQSDQDSWKQQLQLLTENVDIQQIQQTLILEAQNHMGMVNPSEVNPSFSMEPEEATIMETSSSVQQTMTMSRSRRKSHQVARLSSDSPFPIHMDEDTSDIVVTDTKPDIAALSTLNGSASRGRKRVQNAGSEPSTSNGSKRKRKYELDDSEDTSVKNAKAAKLNRDRKKKEMMEMKETIEKLVKDNKELSEGMAAIRTAMAETEKKYQEEKEKNLINNGLAGQLTNAKTILESIVPPLVARLGPMTVSVSDVFESIPVRTDEHGNILFSAAGPTNDSSFTGVDTVSTYTTFHISPQERHIKVDYDPHFC